MNRALKVYAPFLLITIFGASILSFVYAFTESPATETENDLTLNKLHAVINATEYMPVIPETLWQALDSMKNPVGIVFRVFPRGYAGIILVTIGLDLNRQITGIKVAGPGEILKETPGLGAKVVESVFTEQFIGKSVDQLVLKKDGGEIDAITGATVSSRAVCNGIKKGMTTYVCYLADTNETSFINKVFPDARQTFEVIKDTLWYVLCGYDTLGVAFIGSCFGYLDTIKYLVGVKRDSGIAGIEILYSKETEGVGEQIRDKEFLDKFKQGAPEAITGATISSSALIKSVDETIKRFGQYLK